MTRMTRTADKRAIFVVLPVNLLEQLDALAQREHRTRGRQIQHLLARALESAAASLEDDNNEQRP